MVQRRCRSTLHHTPSPASRSPSGTPPPASQVKPRTVSLYGQQGRLRARKVEAKNGLERYLFDPASVDEDIAKRRQGADSYAAPETVYAAANGAGTAHETRHTVHTRCLHRPCTGSSTRRRSGSRFSRPSFAWSGTRGCGRSAGPSRRRTARSRLPSSSASTRHASPCSRRPRKSRQPPEPEPEPDDTQATTMQSPVHRSCAVSWRQLDEAATVQAALSCPCTVVRSPRTGGGRAGRLWITRKGYRATRYHGCGEAGRVPCHEVPWGVKIPCNEVPLAGENRPKYRVTRYRYK